MDDLEPMHVCAAGDEGLPPCMDTRQSCSGLHVIGSGRLVSFCFCLSLLWWNCRAEDEEDTRRRDKASWEEDPLFFFCLPFLFLPSAAPPGNNGGNTAWPAGQPALHWEVWALFGQVSLDRTNDDTSPGTIQRIIEAQSSILKSEAYQQQPTTRPAGEPCKPSFFGASHPSPLSQYDLHMHTPPLFLSTHSPSMKKGIPTPLLFFPILSPFQHA